MPEDILIGSPIRVSLDQRLPAPTQSLSQLATPFIVSQAKPSTRRRQRVRDSSTVACATMYGDNCGTSPLHPSFNKFTC